MAVQVQLAGMGWDAIADAGEACKDLLSASDSFLHLLHVTMSAEWRVRVLYSSREARGGGDGDGAAAQPCRKGHMESRWQPWL